MPKHACKPLEPVSGYKEVVEIVFKRSVVLERLDPDRRETDLPIQLPAALA